MADEFDVVIIGAGPAGENVADRAVQGGLSARSSRTDLVGRRVLLLGVHPSKALLRPST